MDFPATGTIYSNYERKGCWPRTKGTEIVDGGTLSLQFICKASCISLCANKKLKTTSTNCNTSFSPESEYLRCAKMDNIKTFVEKFLTNLKSFEKKGFPSIQGTKNA